MEHGIGLKNCKGDILEGGVATAPLYGFESKLAAGEPGKIEKQVLEKEGVSLKDFRIKKIPELSSKGARRKIVLFPKNLALVETGEDKFYPGKLFAKISFELDKGTYATTVLKEIMKK